VHRARKGSNPNTILFYSIPSDFILFPKLKLFLTGQRFSSNQEAIAAVEGYFADLTKNHYRDRLMALEHRWNECISLKGDYVEK
jgi:hypothetical protein